MISAIFLDFNGVIIDDEFLQFEIYHEVFKEHGIELTHEKYLNSLGMDENSLIWSILGSVDTEVTTEKLNLINKEKKAIYLKRIEESLPLAPGAKNFVITASRQFDVGMVSMAPRLEIDYILKLAGLADYFPVIVSGEDVSKHKPDPECYRLGLRRMNEARRRSRLPRYDANECLVIEDSPPGIKAARAAGMRTIGVTNTVDEEKLRLAGAEVVTRSLADWTLDPIQILF